MSPEALFTPRYAFLRLRFRAPHRSGRLGLEYPDRSIGLKCGSYQLELLEGTGEKMKRLPTSKVVAAIGTAGLADPAALATRTEDVARGASTANAKGRDHHQ